MKIKEIEKKYNLELKKIINEIKNSGAKRVLLQFPDGLKIYATDVVDFLEKKTNSKFFIWFGTCFGACDVPVGVEGLEIDLIVQFGHNQTMPGY